MTFLAPWALALGIAGAFGTVLLHLVARQRPAAYLLPTTRFIPDQQTVVARAAARPHDLLLLLIRVLLLLLAGAAFAQPVRTGARRAHARIVLLDRSRGVAEPADAWRRVRALVGENPGTLLIGFDTTATIIARPAMLDSVAPSPRTSTSAPASLTAAIIAARRAAPALAHDADSVELVLVSPVAASAIDAATLPARALWPGGMRIVRVAARADTVRPATLERTLPPSDALGPALAHVAAGRSPHAVRILRGGALTLADSAFARAGGSVVVWDSASPPVTAQGLAMGDDVIVAPLGRRVALGEGAVIARWADGAPAATEQVIGAGCIRHVGFVVPSIGDVALRAGVQRVVRGLAASCTHVSVQQPADSQTLASLAGPGSPAPAAALSSDAAVATPIVQWLLGGALACALLELLLRRRAVMQAEA